MLLATKTFGIFQSDVVLRTALIAALNDIKKNPWLLDYVFAQLPADPLTNQDPHYGEKGKEEAKKWFLSTDIPVIMADMPDEPIIPSITISLVQSDPAEDTLGDLDFTVFEKVPAEQVGRHDLPRGTLLNVKMEGTYYREAYRLGLHVKGDYVPLLWLHSIVTFALFRYKEKLLEARGLERTKFSSLPMQQNQFFAPEERIFSRYITITGFVRHYWPKEVTGDIAKIETSIEVDSGIGVVPVFNSGPFDMDGQPF